jgi:hypothetical protein
MPSAVALYNTAAEFFGWLYYTKRGFDSPANDPDLGHNCTWLSAILIEERLNE